MKNFKNNFYMLKIIWSAAPERIIAELAAIITVCTVDILYDLFFMRFLIECLQRKVEFASVAAVIIGYFLASFTARVINTYDSYCVYKQSGVKIQEKMMEMIYRQAVRMDLDCYEDAKFYDTYTRANEEILTRMDEVLNLMAEVVAVIFSLAGYGAAVLVYDPFLAPFLVAALAVSRLLQKKYVQYASKRQNEAVHQRRRMDYAKRIVYLQDYAKDLRLTNIFAPVMRNFHRAAAEARQITGQYGKKAGVYRVLGSLVSNLTVFIGVNGFILYRFLLAHAYPLGTMTTILNAANGLNDCLSELVRISGAIQTNGIFIENFRTFVEYEPKMKDSPGAPDVQQGPHELELCDVSFAYHGLGKKVLNHLNIRIPAGQKVAFVGHNGAGKSTLVKLLMRLYDPTEGTIRLDGVDVRDYRIKSYREQFATIFQDFKVFAASVAENVLLDSINGEEDMKRVRQALKDSGIWNKVERLPHGTDSILTKEFDEDGVLMSGGEQQKLAVARVFAGAGSIAVLDEPSSALDPISEYEIFENMMKACEGKTVIFVSHRLSSATLADMVYLFENGQVIEQGSHHELLLRNGKYAEMFRMQAEKYKESAKEEQA